MNVSLNLPAIGKAIADFIRRFHTLLFFLVVSGGLFAAITMLLAVISTSSTTATSSSQAVDGSFDETTIQRLKQPSAAQITPGSRQNPFSE